MEASYSTQHHGRISDYDKYYCFNFLLSHRAFNYPDGFDTVLQYPANRVMLDAGLVFYNSIDWSYSAPPWIVESTLPALFHTNGGFSLESLIAEVTNSTYLSISDEQTSIATVINVMSYLFPAYENFSSFFALVDELRQAISNGPDNLLYPSADNLFDPTENSFHTFLLQLDVNYALNLPAGDLVANPAHVQFPGEFSGVGGAISRNILIAGHYEGLDQNLIYSSPKRQRWHSTGLYVKAGSVITVAVPAAVAAAGTVGIRVGCHSDDTSEKVKWIRMPVITREWPVKNEVPQYHPSLVVLSQLEQF